MDEKLPRKLPSITADTTAAILRLWERLEAAQMRKEFFNDGMIIKDESN